MDRIHRRRGRASSCSTGNLVARILDRWDIHPIERSSRLDSPPLEGTLSTLVTVDRIAADGTDFPVCRNPAFVPDLEKSNSRNKSVKRDSKVFVKTGKRTESLRAKCLKRSDL